SSIKVLQHAFSTLEKDEWIEADDLSAFWDIICPGKERPDNNIICEEGVKWGYLARCKFKKNIHYRPAETKEEEDSDPDRFILKDKNGSLNIDLDTIPFSELELLAGISTMIVEDGKLVFSPDLISIGNHYREIRDENLVSWLKKNSKPFKRALKEVDDKWGKNTIHENIVMARVTDLSLRVRLQKKFTGKKGIHPLNGDFIAFPVALIPDICRSVERAGFVVRVNGSDEGENGGGGRSGT
ncbi:MAG: hypothetical protein U9R75_03935, partial [Candidatus Thermoplasmatota archaeon]|nr:hypothetical protein [Candidatus Thermoplasmatota archaeon]